MGKLLRKDIQNYGNMMNDIIEELIRLGLTDNEARIYIVLIVQGALSGYEAAKRSGIARGNVYPALDRLIAKQAVIKTSDDLFAAVPLAQFTAIQQERFQQAAARAEILLQQLPHTHDHAIALSIRGESTILARCQQSIKDAQAPIFLAAFPEDLETLKPELLEARRRNIPIEVLSYGPPPPELKDACTHSAAADIQAAQGGRLLLLATWPHGLAAVLDNTETCTGLWSWHRYLASVIGLYIAHELFLLRMWPALPAESREQIRTLHTDLSSQIGLSGLVPDAPLLAHLKGTLAPQTIPNGEAINEKQPGRYP